MNKKLRLVLALCISVVCSFAGGGIVMGAALSLGADYDKAESLAAIATVASLIGVAAMSTDKKAAERGMVRACADLATAFAAGCATKPVGNLKTDIWLFNRDDVDWDASTVSGRLFTDIVMKSGKFMYKYVGKKTSNNSAINMHQSKYDNDWIHTVGLVIFDNTAATKEDIIEKLAAANLCAIVRNNWTGTNSNMEFELFGRYAGLEASNLEKKSDDADTQGAWKGILATPKDIFEDNAGYIVWDTDQTTTYNMLMANTSGS